jgi:hypothetical protein
MEPTGVPEHQPGNNPKARINYSDHGKSLEISKVETCSQM